MKDTPFSTLFLGSVILCHVPLLAWRQWNLYSLFSWFVQDQPIFGGLLKNPVWKKPSIALILRRCHSSVSQRAHTCLVWQTFLMNGTLLTLFLRSVIFCHVPLLAWRHWNLYSLFSWYVQDQPIYWWTLGKPSSKILLVIKIRPHSSLRRPHSSVSQRATHV